MSPRQRRPGTGGITPVTDPSRTHAAAEADWTTIRMLWEHVLCPAVRTPRPGVRQPEIKLSCRCGWVFAIHDWADEGPTVDAHLWAVLGPRAVTAPCWCGRMAVRVAGNGHWYHAAVHSFMGHDAFEGTTPPAAGVSPPAQEIQEPQ